MVGTRIWHTYSWTHIFSRFLCFVGNLCFPVKLAAVRWRCCTNLTFLFSKKHDCSDYSGKRNRSRTVYTYLYFVLHLNIRTGAGLNQQEKIAKFLLAVNSNMRTRTLRIGKRFYSHPSTPAAHFLYKSDAFLPICRLKTWKRTLKCVCPAYLLIGLVLFRISKSCPIWNERLEKRLCRVNNTRCRTCIQYQQCLCSAIVRFSRISWFLKPLLASLWSKKASKWVFFGSVLSIGICLTIFDSYFEFYPTGGAIAKKT